MGRSGVKKQGRSASIVHKVIGVRKSKTTAVTKNLKKMNFHNKSKTVDADREFRSIHSVLVSGEVKELKKETIKHKPTANAVPHPPPDVDSAMESMEVLQVVKT